MEFHGDAGMSFKVITDNFEYEPAAPGLGEGPHYLVTPSNNEGMCLELFYTTAPEHVRKDQVCIPLYKGERVWKVTEYDRDGDDMDTYYFKNFADADAHAFGLWTDSYDHDELHAGG